MVIGVDVNSWCVKAATENLEWLEQEYHLTDADFRVIQGDVSHLAERVGVESVDCTVSEPDLDLHYVRHRLVHTHRKSLTS